MLNVRQAFPCHVTLDRPLAVSASLPPSVKWGGTSTAALGVMGTGGACLARPLWVTPCCPVWSWIVTIEPKEASSEGGGA